MESMTGFGSSTFRGEGFLLLAEARSVNHKTLSPSISLPDSLLSCEPELRRKIGNRFNRGRIKVNVSIEFDGGSDQLPSVNMEIVQQYMEALHVLREKYDLTDGISGEAILQLPGVSSMNRSPRIDDDVLRKVFSVCTEQCLDGLKESRCKEGAAILPIFEEGFRTIRKMAEPVLEVQCQNVQERFTRLRERVAQLASDVELDQNRMIQELALLADRSDVSEEVQRLQCHLDHVEEVIQISDGSQGRRLGFIIQEMHRELNTMGSKVDSARLSLSVIDMKNVLASLKEQAANIE